MSDTLVERLRDFYNSETVTTALEAADRIEALQHSHRALQHSHRILMGKITIQRTHIEELEQQLAIPETMVKVPVEPTEGMIVHGQFGFNTATNFRIGIASPHVRAIWQAMIKASQGTDDDNG